MSLCGLANVVLVLTLFSNAPIRRKAGGQNKIVYLFCLFILSVIFS
jgi:hypothetical protein